MSVVIDCSSSERYLASGEWGLWLQQLICDDQYWFIHSMNRQLKNNDDIPTVERTETQQLINTIFINFILFIGMVALFEIVRRKKSIFACRCIKKFIEATPPRVPIRPNNLPFSWINHIMQVKDDHLLEMIGLDGYMCIRYITICFRTGCFLSFWGLVVLIPIFQLRSREDNNSIELNGWDRYTLANIPDDPEAYRLWAPVIFMYLFSLFFCQLLYFEYKNFVKKRVHWLVHGDPDTPLQTYYTIMIERVPTKLRSVINLYHFFHEIFPNDVFKVELAIDLNELEMKCKERENIRNQLEKSVAKCWAEMKRPTVWVRRGSTLYEAPSVVTHGTTAISSSPPAAAAAAVSLPLPSLIKTGYFIKLFGYEVHDAIDYYFFKLALLNNEVKDLQDFYISKRKQLDDEIIETNLFDDMEQLRLLRLGNQLQIQTSNTLKRVSKSMIEAIKIKREMIHKGRQRKGSLLTGYFTPSHRPNNKQNHSIDHQLTPTKNSKLLSNQELFDVHNEKEENSISNTNDDDDEGSNEEELEIMKAIVNTSENDLHDAVTLDELRDLLHDMKHIHHHHNHHNHHNSYLINHTDSTIDDVNYQRVTSVIQTTTTTKDHQSSSSSSSSLVHNDPMIQMMPSDEKNNDGNKVTMVDRLRNTSIISTSAEIVGTAGGVARSGLVGVAHEGAKTAEFAAKGAIRSVLEVTRALELLTFGAYYRISSTAFVTFHTLVAKSSAHQMLLSHEHYGMKVHSAPNPKDVIWDNVAIFQRQIDIRKMIADGTLIVGAIFWSIVVTFIFAVSNLTSIADVIPILHSYSDTSAYILLNTYLAIIVLLILLSILPLLFDFISRYYEGLKLESEIQNSIMNRYFYYQLANVYVSVGLGSIASSLHSILSNPANILSILGASVPSFSIYFANLVIVKTLTALPLEMLRIFPLLDITLAGLWYNKKKLTRRELRTGSFAPLPMLYGWIYPNLLMVLMIMFTYACIAPFILPMCTLFFGLAFLMYKYQLLYVYVNDYQSGGFMWFAVFGSSMVVLLAAVFTLLCYLAIRLTFISGPFYLLLPLPFLICLFWHHCDAKIKTPCINLSLHQAKKIDQRSQRARDHGEPGPEKCFDAKLFRQPALAEEKLKPEYYRKEQRAKHQFLPPGLDHVRHTAQTQQGHDGLRLSISTDGIGDSSVGQVRPSAFDIDQGSTDTSPRPSSFKMSTIGRGENTSVQEKATMDDYDQSPPSISPRPSHNSFSTGDNTRPSSMRSNYMRGMEVRTLMDEDIAEEEDNEINQNIDELLSDEKQSNHKIIGHIPFTRHEIFSMGNSSQMIDTASVRNPMSMTSLQDPVANTNDAMNITQNMKNSHNSKTHQDPSRESSPMLDEVQAKYGSTDADKV